MKPVHEKIDLDKIGRSVIIKSRGKSVLNLDKINPAHLWYVIGYIVADGNLSVDGRHINITSKDRGHLYFIRNSLGLQVKIGKKGRKQDSQKVYSYFCISSVTFYRYLLYIGLIPQKSLSLGQIKINENFFTDFLRGIIDGDGNISYWTHKTNATTQWCLRIFSGSFSFIDWLNRSITDHFGIQGRIIRKNSLHTLYTLKYGKKSAGHILKELYYPNCLALKRKMILAHLCLQSPVKMVN